MCDEHGEAQVPLWSSVQILGIDPAEASEKVAQIRGNRRLFDFVVEVEQHKQPIFDLLTAERICEAFNTVEGLAPDLRVVLEPWVTAHCLHSTANATANATCDFICALYSGQESVVAAQVRLAGEFHDLHASIGVPVLVNAKGWSQILCPPLADDEAQQLTVAAETIKANVAQWLG